MLMTMQAFTPYGSIGQGANPMMIIPDYGMPVRFKCAAGLRYTRPGLTSLIQC